MYVYMYECEYRVCSNIWGTLFFMNFMELLLIHENMIVNIRPDSIILQNGL